MNEVKTFENEDFGQIRTVTIDGEPWLVGKDVATALGYSNSRKALTDHVDDEDKGVTKCATLGGQQNLVVINESGLYSLIMSSKLPSAKKFKRWVTSEVLPALRKNRYYSMNSKYDAKYNNLKDIAKKQSLIEKDTYKYSEKDLSVWQSCVANNAIQKIAEAFGYSNSHTLSMIYKKMYELFGFDSLQAMKEFSEKHGDEFQKCTYLMAVADDANYREMFVRSADELLKNQEEYQKKAANVFSVEDKQNVELDRYGNPILFQYLREDDYISLLYKVSKQIGDSSVKKMKTSKYIYDKMYDSEEWQIIQDCWHCRSKKNLVTSVCRYAECFIEVCQDCTE